MPIATPAAPAQSDQQIWKKVNTSLMDIGVPVTPIMIRRAKGTMLYVRWLPCPSFCLAPKAPWADRALKPRRCRRRLIAPPVQDVNEREILDFTSGQMSSILGHSHPEIVEVISSQIGKLDHLLSSFISEPVADLADLLTSLCPAPLDKTFFLNTGAPRRPSWRRWRRSLTLRYARPCSRQAPRRPRRPSRSPRAAPASSRLSRLPARTVRPLSLVRPWWICSLALKSDHRNVPFRARSQTA